MEVSKDQSTRISEKKSRRDAELQISSFVSPQKDKIVRGAIEVEFM